MTVTPFSPGAIAARRNAESFGTMRREFDDLQRQLATGKRAESYAGLGLGRRTSLDVRGKLSGIQGYQDAIASGDLRLKLMTKGLETLAKSGLDQKSRAALAPFELGASGRTLVQELAVNNLKQAIEVLNSDVNGRYLFSGRADDTRPVADMGLILDGGGGLRGLRQVIADAKVADRGVAGMGHVMVGLDSPTVARIAETAGNVLNGYSLVPDPGAGSGSIAVAHVAGAPGARALTFTVNAAPYDGEVLRFSLGLKDGSMLPIELRARTGGTTTADATSFQIGTPAQTATNLSAALSAAVSAATAGPVFAAGSAMAASDRFFAGQEPSTVDWYAGESTAGPPGEPYSLTARNGVPVRADATQTVGVGARADEEAFRKMLSGFAVMAVETFSGTPELRATEAARHAALAERSGERLDPERGQGSVKDVLVDLANAAGALDGAKARHTSAKAMWEGAVADVENANPEEVAAAILALQTRMQASYQTTSILSRLSLANYL